jgi:stress response protein SCP2
MSTALTTGANAPLPDVDVVRVEVTWASGGPGLDVAALLVTGSGKVRSDDDFVFFNQPASADGAVRHTGGPEGRDALEVSPAKLPAEVERVVITASVDAAAEPGTTFSSVRGIAVGVHGGATGDPLVTFAPTDLGTQTALVLVELYRRQGAWKVRAVGQGYASGLAGIATTYGISVADETEPVPTAAAAPPAPAPAAAPSALNLTKPLPTDLPVDLSKRIGPRLEKADAVILRKGLAGVTAQVALVVDCSGSMTSLFSEGTVAETVERVMAVAERFDDDGMMDVWQFASGFKRLAALTLPELDTYVGEHMRKLPGGIGFGNNEPLVMKDLLAFYRGEPSVPPGMSSKEARKLEKVDTRRKGGLFGRRKDDAVAPPPPPGTATPGKDPVYVVFVSDGGIYKNEAIKEVLTEASGHPIFWQFVGIGRADYGVLEDLDSMAGRRVDNAGFFALDDIEKVDDDELYDRLLTEFPVWLKAARSAGVLS